MTATAFDVAAEAPWSFLIGAAIGFFVGAKFTIIKRNGKEGE